MLLCALFLMIAIIGEFEEGKTAAVLGGLAFGLAALPMLVAPFALRLAKVLLAAFLLVFSLLMIIAAFNPPAAVTSPGVYQVAAIALAVLVISRLVLAWGRRAPAARA